MRGVILAGGFGTRMMSSTRVINKHLLPVYSELDGAPPMIHYPINTLINSGITDILIITSDEAAGLMVETLGDGKRFGKNVNFTYKIQNMHDPSRPIGIAGALKLSEDFVRHESSFAVILGDNFYEDSFADEVKRFEEQCLKTLCNSNSKSNTTGHVFLKSVYDPERFGVASLDGTKVVEIVEKPKNPISNYAVTGFYLFNTFLYNTIRHLKVSARGELEVSDINDYIVKVGTMNSTIMNGYWSDMGIPSSMIRTIEFLKVSNFKLSFNK